MDRVGCGWDRVVVCLNRSVVTVMGQRVGSPASESALVINRVNLKDIREVPVGDSTADLGSVVTGSALIGFIDLKHATFLGIVTKASEAGRIQGHTVLSISDVEWIPVSFGVNQPSKPDARYLSLISNLLKGGGDFYFSPTLNLAGSNTTRFMWNYIHTRALAPFQPAWTVHVMHGSFRSLRFDSLNRQFIFALIARRSRFFAGTRYRKRGLNWSGDCANEVETEQLLVSLGPPDRVLGFKQVRGSVPLHWTQEAQNLLGRPEIAFQHLDIELKSTVLHFRDLHARYGPPVLPVSLLMQKEGSAESVLGTEFDRAVKYLSARSSEGDVFGLRPAIHGVSPVVAFDLKMATTVNRQGSSTPDFDRDSSLDSQGSSPVLPDHHGTRLLNPAAMFTGAHAIASELISSCGWTEYDTGGWKAGKAETASKQKGVIRTNCVDCLDRTSIFQYVVGLEVLNRQLTSLHVLDPACALLPSWATLTPTLTPSLCTMIEEMFDSVSDQLALQYAGTAAHKKYSSGSSSGWAGRDWLISISRHYSSAFTDSDKQHAMNLFLGLYAEILQDSGGGAGSDESDLLLIENIDRFVHWRPTVPKTKQHQPDHPADVVEKLSLEPPPSALAGRPSYVSLSSKIVDSKHIYFNSSSQRDGIET